MSRKRRSEALIGAFIVAGVGLFVLLLFLMGSMDSLYRKSVSVEADFGDVQGLQTGDPVFLFGMKVGKVASLGLLPRETGKPASIRMTFRMPVEFRPYLREDSRIKVDKSLTGNISVVIQESGGNPLPEGARLKGAPAADFGVVTEKVNQVLDEGEKLVQTISRMVKEIEARGDLTSAVSEVAALVKDVRSEIGPLRENIRQTLELVQGIMDENRLDIRHTVANLKEATALAKSFTERIGATPESIERSLAELEKAGGAVSGMIQDNRVHVDTILEDLRATSTSAANLTAEIKRRPWRLLYRPSEDEERAMDLYDAAWAYNLGATELNRSVRDLAAHLERSSRTGAEEDVLKDAVDRVRQSLDKHRQAEEAFWERLRAAE